MLTTRSLITIRLFQRQHRAQHGLAVTQGYNTLNKGQAPSLGRAAAFAGCDNGSGGERQLMHRPTAGLQACCHLCVSLFGWRRRDI